MKLWRTAVAVAFSAASFGCIMMSASAGQVHARALEATVDPRLAAYVRPGGRVEIGGRRLDLRCSGKGKPTVILAEGLGGFSISWFKVQPEVARLTRTCAFDRAGFGYSDAPPTPQSVADVAADLHAALRAARIPPPYVLVGQSLGGIEVRLFAQRWRREVAGMVLVDSSFAEQGILFARLPGASDTTREATRARRQRCLDRAVAGPLAYDPADPDGCVIRPWSEAPDDLRALWPTFARASSFAGMLSLGDPSSLARFASADTVDLGDRPLIVLTAGRSEFGPDAMLEYRQALTALWRERQVALTRLSRRGEQRIVDAGHNMHRERPEAVIVAIHDVLDRLQRH